MTRLFPALAASALLASGSSVSSSGEVFGERPRFVEAIYGEFEVGDVGIVYGMIVGYGDACDRYGEFRDELDEARDADDLVELWAETFPEDFWELSFIAVFDDYDDAFDTELEVYTQGRDEGFLAELIHYEEHLDEDFFLQEAPLDAYADTSLALDDLELTLERRDRKGPIRGELKGEFFDAEGDDVGEAEIRFVARYCSDLDAVARSVVE